VTTTLPIGTFLKKKKRGCCNNKDWLYSPLVYLGASLPALSFEQRYMKYSPVCGNSNLPLTAICHMWPVGFWAWQQHITCQYICFQGPPVFYIF
jgi:hypothetical protein